MSGSGKGGNNRRRHHRFSGRRDEPQKNTKPPTLFSDGKLERNKVSLHERLRWTAPVLPANPITTPDCKWCGQKITDITTAICDKETGFPVHFDCVLTRIAEMERLETNDSICYIGGGRFGILHHKNPLNTRDFTIKRIYEWEPREQQNEWRRPICEYYSLT